MADAVLRRAGQVAGMATGRGVLADAPGPLAQLRHPDRDAGPLMGGKF
jgi:hypothetical protein